MIELNDIHDAIDRWSSRSEEWSRLAVLVDGAALAAEVVRDLQTIVNSAENALLTLTEAGGVCGYSADHLGRLVRAGRLKNYGVKGAPRVKQSELPRRPAKSVIAGVPEKQYDPTTDARFLRARR